jgi:two-component flavin-dependent monooxygenase
MLNTNSAPDAVQTPVGAWTGTVRFDDQANPYDISFAPEGTIALHTPVTVGTGTWVAGQEGRFSFDLIENFTPASGRAGRIEVHVEAHLEGTAHKGVGTARIYTPDDVLVHSTAAEFAGDRVIGMSLSTPTQASMAEVTKLAGAQAAQADAERRVSPDVMRAVVEAGFARWLVPTRWGGDERGYQELTAAVTKLGAECSSTAWLACLAAHAARYVACLPEQGQADVWGDGPDPLVAAVIKPLGAAVAVEGGFRLTGSWTYVSGVEYADWVLVTGPAPGPKSGGQPMRLFAVPRGDYTFEDTWSSLGMRGTGSHTLILADVFVPEHRVCLREDAMRGATVGLPGRTPLPNAAVSGLTFVTPALGAARGALAVAAQLVAVAPTGPRAGAGQAYQVDFARAAGEIDTAQLLLERGAAVVDAGALSPDLARRNRRDFALALQMLADATDRLLRIGGTRAQEDGHPLQRYWRDVRSVTGHAVVQFEPAAIDYTQGLAGLA